MPTATSDAPAIKPVLQLYKFLRDEIRLRVVFLSSRPAGARAVSFGFWTGEGAEESSQGGQKRLTTKRFPTRPRRATSAPRALRASTRSSSARPRGCTRPGHKAPVQSRGRTRTRTRTRRARTRAQKMTRVRMMVITTIKGTLTLTVITSTTIIAGGTAESNV